MISEGERCDKSLRVVGGCSTTGGLNMQLAILCLLECMRHSVCRAPGDLDGSCFKALGKPTAVAVTGLAVRHGAREIMCTTIPGTFLCCFIVVAAKLMAEVNLWRLEVHMLYMTRHDVPPFSGPR